MTPFQSKKGLPLFTIRNPIENRIDIFQSSGRMELGDAYHQLTDYAIHVAETCLAKDAIPLT